MKGQEKKLSLEDLHVQSFVTSLDWDKQKEIKGGSGTEQEGTQVPIFCRDSNPC
ncbi:MAG: hypothetical protein GTO45_19895 [Candidatus Aminicenantes bacterium]|nr:hypothetical protein [Candidatus Aminicenantes bacterium]NIM81057.1 hypothetical protein [Candidatus Aminicenantes bacterium]NIN20434.1 hypothetical protein [Candidatus Aminicenantes bacterium]NIN44207.1 hypothetical protein [Candidatus Aminicenantes bacterium]NIN87025.1 hypothetical protein [Candidatus Aminicenantes bacterium]